MLINFLHAVVTCPRCGFSGEVEIEAALDGRGPIQSYRLGDEITEWNPGMRADGYAVCPACNKDYFVIVSVVRDVIHSVDVDAGRPGHIS